jgi:RNA polymerase sigma factor (sigma-70 family)
MDVSDTARDRRCREVIDRLLARYGWELLDRESFAQRTIVAAQANPAIDVAYLAFGVYNQALYNACSGNEGPFRWEQGYKEIFEMLCDRARRIYPDVWEDAVQAALEMICQRFERCIVPHAFFQFAWGHVQNAARSQRSYLRRGNHQSDLSLERSIGDDEVTLADSLTDPHADFEMRILSDEQRTELHAILAAFTREHPRARNQLIAVRLKFLDDKDDETIGQILGVPVKRVHELRSLGLKKLRADPRLGKLLGDAAE